MNASQKQQQVLSTLNIDGSRRWIRPRPNAGRFLSARRVVAYFLIAVFTLLPYIRVDGKPSILLDIIRREFTLFGTTFYPTDTLLLALLVLSWFVSIFLVTAFLGRFWCGWLCPQTVYMEFVYRPIERLFEGKPGGRKKTGGWRKPAKILAYLLISMFLAHTFLAYFVGIDQLVHWIGRSPLNHPTSFLVMAFVTAMMMFDFAFFREQTCIVACPYGRFQSVLLDRNSLIVGYDKTRGEPRGKKIRTPKGGEVALNVIGDCVDCNKCVTCCPTGIDIRDGLQMECIGCAQCVDACDSVMDKIGRARGLIRYSSQAALEGGKRKVVRPRTLLYPLLLGALLTGLVLTAVGRTPAEISIIRARGQPFYVSDNEIINNARIRVRNRTDTDVSYSVQLIDVADGHLLIDEADGALTVGAGALASTTATIAVTPAAFANGDFVVTVRVTGSDGYAKDVEFRLFGPRYTPPTDGGNDQVKPGDG